MWLLVDAPFTPLAMIVHADEGAGSDSGVHFLSLMVCSCYQHPVISGVPSSSPSLAEVQNCCKAQKCKADCATKQVAFSRSQ